MLSLADAFRGLRVHREIDVRTTSKIQPAREYRIQLSAGRPIVDLVQWAAGYQAKVHVNRMNLSRSDPLGNFRLLITRNLNELVVA